MPGKGTTAPMKIDRIEKDPKLDDIIVVTAEDGAQIRYRMGEDGVLRPGRVWQCMNPPNQPCGNYTVTIFIPLPDGRPEVLKVHAH